MTVQQLIDELEMMEQPDAEVRLATQPSWPMEYGVSDVAATFPDDEDEAPVVYLGEGEQIGYLPGIARDALGW